MLFNSNIFIFVFLPITLLGFYLTTKIFKQSMTLLWLSGASIFFYCWWNFHSFYILVASIAINYILSIVMMHTQEKKLEFFTKLLLVIGLLFNILLLVYFKYMNFFITNIKYFITLKTLNTNIILPLAISFFTFQKIAYLVDVYQRKITEKNLLKFFFFVMFFPPLIAGPIVHYREMTPQLSRLKLSRINLVIGFTLFFIGLTKKVICADSIAEYINPIYEQAASGQALAFFTAWAAALGFTFQIYFDFSGYSDMAIGLARLFSIKLPTNFNSPYKSTSIIDFWRRWHITLSRFLRDYIYIPLGGNRQGHCRRYINLMAVMLIGGLWHGASWTFIFWGGLHGLYLTINHFWRAINQSASMRYQWFIHQINKLSWPITFLSVVIGWVFFRATSFKAALAILGGMIKINQPYLHPAFGIFIHRLLFFRIHFNEDAMMWQPFMVSYFWIILLGYVSIKLPNSIYIMRRYKPTLDYQQYLGTSKPFMRKQQHFKLLAIRTGLFLFLTSFIIFKSVNSQFIYFKF